MAKSLNHTLWRTCRVLCGKDRLALLGEILANPGQNVSRLAQQMGISISAASQELRRLQSRGLLRRASQGPSVVYTPDPDPQVPSAAPILAVLKTALAESSAPHDVILRIAKGLSSEKRILLLRELRAGPQTVLALSRILQTSSMNTRNHLAALLSSGWIAKEGHRYARTSPSHPFMATLSDWL